MRKCKDCKFFKPNYYIPNKNFGMCNSNNFVYAEDLKAFKNTTQLVYSDSEGYLATVYVGKDFGCMHFRKKIDKGD